MSTTGQFSSKNPTIKRILREAAELAQSPSSDYHAAPLETDLFEWHFTLRGPPSPSPFEGGLYHGRIVLPPAYPLKPPSFRFATPSGRFEVNREICLSISGHHEETWQPAWGIRTALVAIRSFMDTDAKGQLGGMDAGEEVRRRFAGQSKAWRCAACGKRNEEVMQEHEEAVKESGTEGAKGEGEKVPEGLRLAYREELGQGGKGETKAQPETEATGKASATQSDPAPPPAIQANTPTAPSVSGAPVPVPATAPAPATAVRIQAQTQQVRLHPPREDVPAWIDKAIYGVIAAILALVWVKYFA